MRLGRFSDIAQALVSNNEHHSSLALPNPQVRHQQNLAESEDHQIQRKHHFSGTHAHGGQPKYIPTFSIMAISSSAR